MLRLLGYALMAAACMALLVMLLAASSSGITTLSSYIYGGITLRASAYRGQSLLMLFEPQHFFPAMGSTHVEGFTSALDVELRHTQRVTLELVLFSPTSANLTQPAPVTSVLLENLTLRDLSCYMFDRRTYRSRVEPLLDMAAGDWFAYDLLERALGLAASEVKGVADPAGGYRVTLQVGNETVALCALGFDASSAHVVFSNGTRTPPEVFFASLRSAAIQPGVSRPPPYLTLNVELRAYLLFKPTAMQVVRALALLAAGAVLVALDVLLTGSPPFLFLHKLRRILRRRGT
ncbi:MAG: hypothetical protein LM565_05605 [Thermofilum sp.]|nr:hypothetical protein [Thermofilum sp.]